MNVLRFSYNESFTVNARQSLPCTFGRFNPKIEFPFRRPIYNDVFLYILVQFIYEMIEIIRKKCYATNGKLTRMPLLIQIICKSAIWI